MDYICVICTLNRPPLLPLAIEHRVILEAIVSPVVNMDDLKSCYLLLCMDCQVKMLSVHQFQKTALQGIRNLKYLLSRFNAPPPLQPVVPKKTEDTKLEPIIIKIEHTSDEESDTAETEDKNVKMDLQHQPEPAAQSDSGLAVSCQSDGRESSAERPTSSNAVTEAAHPAVSTRPVTRQAAAAARAPGRLRARKHTQKEPTQRDAGGAARRRHQYSHGKVKKAHKEHLLSHRGLRAARCTLRPATSDSASLHNHLKKRGKKKEAEC